MKKALIITAVLFVISSLLVVVSAVALGADAIPKLIDSIKEGGILEKIENGGELFENIENGANEFADKVKDGAENYVGDGMIDGRDFSIIGNPDLQISGDRATSLDISNKESIVIHADVADVVIKTTDDKFMSAQADVYSKKNDVVTGGYEMIFFKDGYDVYLKSDKHIKDAVCELTVEIPESYKGKVVVSVDVGSIEFDEVALEELEASVHVGDITADLLSVNNAKLLVDTGNIDIGKSFFCLRSLEANVRIGEVSYIVPESRKVDINYCVETGGVDVEKLDTTDFAITSTSEAGLSGVNTSGKIIGSYGDEAEDNHSEAIDKVLAVKIEVVIGSIEFDIQ